MKLKAKASNCLVLDGYDDRDIGTSPSFLHCQIRVTDSFELLICELLLHSVINPHTLPLTFQDKHHYFIK